jgi:hypothetical protein
MKTAPLSLHQGAVEDGRSWIQVFILKKDWEEDKGCWETGNKKVEAT